MMRAWIFGGVFLSGCSLLIEEAENDNNNNNQPIQIILECRPGFEHVVGVWPLLDAGMPSEGRIRALGQRRFDVAGGLGALVADDGRVLLLDLSDPMSPSVVDGAPRAFADFTAFYVGLEAGRVAVIGSQQFDLFVMDFDPADRGLPPLFEVGGASRAEAANLSVSQGCAFAGERGDPVYAWTIGSGAPPIELAIEDAQMGVDSEGLGFGEDGLVSTTPDCMMTQTAVQDFFQGELMDVHDGDGFFARNENVIVRDLRNNGIERVTLSPGGFVYDVHADSQYVVMGAGRDIVRYDRATLTVQGVWPVPGDVVAVIPNRGDAQDLIHALIVRRSEAGPRYELMTVAPEAECAS